MNEEPAFLSVDQVREMHRAALEAFGGHDGLRDPGLFEGAVFHPQNVYFYGGGDPFETAAAYAFSIAEAQAFLDGNKRTAVLAALTFLEINGIEIPGESMRLYDALIGVAEGRTGRSDLAALLRDLAGRE